ncbi:MAG: hypothetical protein M1814_002618 [Vezdaea aestivalis]|nr:MAG: hypothetical protein M1814_002618 [Vezdaea aestivalis]
MAESLGDLLSPSINPFISHWDHTATNYLNSLHGASIDTLVNSEASDLAHSSHKLLLSLQSLSTKSHYAIIASSDSCETFKSLIPTLTNNLKSLQSLVPSLDEEVNRFTNQYGKNSESNLLDRRKKALLLLRNSDRLSDILELPSLLVSAIQSTSGFSNAAGGPQASGINYASALDLYSHTKRLHALYFDSALVAEVAVKSEQAMQSMTSNLISSLKTSNVKLAGGIRTIGWLRRIAPELDGSRGSESGGSREGSLGALFLVCRLANLLSMLEALDPLRELAEAETTHRESRKGKAENSWAGGQQTEKYLKRYIEVFREQSFAIISMYRSIFPSEPISQTSSSQRVDPKLNVLRDAPSPLATFPLHLVDLLTNTLRIFLPNIQDKTSKESLLTQVLYCAGSLGRLGGDFSMVLALLEDDLEETESEEWVGVIRKHRVLSSKLELLASGVDGSRTLAKESLAVR